MVLYRIYSDTDTYTSNKAKLKCYLVIKIHEYCTRYICFLSNVNCNISESLMFFFSYKTVFDITTIDIRLCRVCGFVSVLHFKIYYTKTNLL